MDILILVDKKRERNVSVRLPSKIPQATLTPKWYVFIRCRPPPQKKGKFILINNNEISIMILIQMDSLKYGSKETNL